MTPFPAPVGRTARRVEWAHLPPRVRAEVERRLGSPVVEARSQGAGYTPGFASVLVTADGRRHFVKAASLKAQRMFAGAYRQEANVLAALPAAAPAPRLRWTCTVEDWFVLSTEFVAARAPRRPWQPAELARCLDALADLAHDLTPVPAGLGLGTLSGDLADWPAAWDYLLQTFVLPHGEEAAELATRIGVHLVGESLVHADVRDDNVLLADDGRVLLCDWNWPVTGPAWMDALTLLIAARGDGVDVERLVADHRAFAGADPEAIDCALAALTGYFLRHADDPVPSNSPYIRDVQHWQGDVCWGWLCERRGWEVS